MLWHTHVTQTQHSVYMHWGTCPLDFQLFNFSGHIRATKLCHSTPSGFTSTAYPAYSGTSATQLLSLLIA